MFSNSVFLDLWFIGVGLMMALGNKIFARQIIAQNRLFLGVDRSNIVWVYRLVGIAGGAVFVILGLVDLATHHSK